MGNRNVFCGSGGRPVQPWNEFPVHVFLALYSGDLIICLEFYDLYKFIIMLLHCLWAAVTSSAVFFFFS